MGHRRKAEDPGAFGDVEDGPNNIRGHTIEDDENIVAAL